MKKALWVKKFLKRKTAVGNKKQFYERNFPGKTN